MKKFVNYSIIPELKIIVECYKGQFTSVDGINYKKNLYQDKDYNPAYNMITDLRELEMHVKVEDDIKELTTYFDFLKTTAVERKVALITSKPNQAVLAHLFKELARNSIIEYEVFSTLEAAIGFVGLALNQSDTINQALVYLNDNTSK
jgi:hypothetical protein